MRDQMMPPRFLCSATLISAGGVIAALGGCSGSPAPIPQSQLSASAHNVRQGVDRAWAAAGLGPQNLIYVSNSDGLVNVYHYWQRTLVGVLTDFKQPMGMCVDNEQNVYITDYGAETIVEYPHGGTTPIQTINDAPYGPYNCSVDPTTGDLAIANYSEPGENSYYSEYGN